MTLPLRPPLLDEEQRRLQQVAVDLLLLPLQGDGLAAVLRRRREVRGDPGPGPEQPVDALLGARDAVQERPVAARAAIANDALPAGGDESGLRRCCAQTRAPTTFTSTDVATCTSS